MNVRTLVTGLAGLVIAVGAQAGGQYFGIKVVDEQSGRGVPLVELETVNHIQFVTDSNGWAAFDEPGLMDQEVFFHVRSHGYEFPKDNAGFAGVRLRVTPGGRAEIKIKRRNIAERLYRVTGGGIYRDSVLLGEKVPVQAPVLNAQVLGQDSVQAVKYRSKIYWFWGDTNRPQYPLGHFQTAGATSMVPRPAWGDPSVGVEMRYFTDAAGMSKRMAPFSEPGMVWLDGVLTIPDETGRVRLVAHYARMKSLSEMLEHGLAVFNDDKEEFEKLVEFDVTEPWRCPRGHPVEVMEAGTNYFYFPAPLATVRVKAKWADLKNPDSYESLPGRTNEPVLKDVDTGADVKIHGGSINWNAYRKKWILIGVQLAGTSLLGEVWYAEADKITGPWRWAKKIVTHDRYSFYNPTQHPFFDQDNGRIIYFEGTYAQTFSGNPVPTPRYDYNQIMYRLDLSDPRLEKTRARPPGRALVD